MAKRNKIPAFTLSEMMVVIALTAVVVAMAFSVLSLVQRQMKGMEENFAKDTGLELLEQALWLDFNRYRVVSFNPSSDEIHFRTELDSVYYQLHENRVIKYPDTFNIRFPVKKFYRDGREVTGGIIDALQLETSSDTIGNRKLFVFKKNDATQYMNQSKH